jgi:hypothetical protein
MPEGIEVEVSPDPEQNFVHRTVLLVNLLPDKMTWTFAFPSSESYAQDGWYTVAPSANESDFSAKGYMPANASFRGDMKRYQFFDIVVSAVKHLNLSLNEPTERRCYISVVYVNDEGANVDFNLTLDVNVTLIAGRASASHSLLSATVCPSSPNSNCTSISKDEPLTAPIPALTKMTWTLSTRDKLGHSRSKSDEEKVTVRCRDEDGTEHNGTDSKPPYGACIIKEPSDEKNGNYTFDLTPLRAGNLTLVVMIGNETVPQAAHMTFEVSKPICPANITVLSEAEEDIRNPCVCAVGTKKVIGGNTASAPCELCPVGTFTFKQGDDDCAICPKEARCLGGADVLNAVGFWVDLECVASGVETLSISREPSSPSYVFKQCPIMKCPGDETACTSPNRTSLFAQELSSLYRRLPSVATSNISQSKLSLTRDTSCPRDKCPEDVPWLSTISFKCYATRSKTYYIYCAPSAPLRISEFANSSLLQLTSLQCNEGYEGRLCASCTKDYGVKVRPCALLVPTALVNQPADRDVCRVIWFAKRAPMSLRTGFLPYWQCCSARLSSERRLGSLSEALE